MTNQVDVDPSLTIVAQGDIPYPPALVKIAQLGANVVVVVTPPTLTTGFEVTQLSLFRGPSPLGPCWVQVDTRQISDISIPNNLFDTAPLFGTQQYYSATAIDTNFNQSAKTAARAYSASAAAAAAASTTS